MMTLKKKLLLSAVIGLLAALLVGCGEFLLHFDHQGRFNADSPYQFMQGISATRTSYGHFIAVLSGPLYIIGFWHLMKMLEPANKLLATIGFVLLSYGIIIGLVWIGSRADISAIINQSVNIDQTQLIALYQARYESLLQVTRLIVLLFSAIFVGLIATGKTHYPRWFMLFNPFTLILLNFAIWLISPAVGIYLMPIALNTSFALLFTLSLFIAIKIKQ